MEGMERVDRMSDESRQNEEEGGWEGQKEGLLSLAWRLSEMDEEVGKLD